VLGVAVFGEIMHVERWIGFGLVWLALVVFTVDLVRARPRRVAAVAATSSSSTSAARS
jgi:chloramphenicol-sensitive protein RarD